MSPVKATEAAPRSSPALLAAGLAALLLATALPASPARAQAPPAGMDLVVDMGDGRVTVDHRPWREGMTGLDLLQSGRLPVVVAGGAVCAVGGVGCPATECFCACKGPEDCRFWGYHHGDAAGAWTAAETGAGQFTVPAGALEGWVWGREKPLEAPPPWRAGRRGLDWVARAQTVDGGVANHVGFTAEAAAGARALGAAARLDPVPLDVLALRRFLHVRSPAYARSAAETGKAMAGLAAAGGDPRRTSGVDLVARLGAAYDPATGRYGSGAWDQSWAIIGLVAAGEPVPPMAVQALLASSKPAGGWGAPDLDSTGLALMAAMAVGVSKQDPVVARAIAYLARSQGAGGGWGDAPGNVNTTAYVSAALLAAGEDLRAGAWVGGHPGPLAFLQGRQQADGRLRFGDQDDDTSDLVATLQALPSLAGRPWPFIGPAPARRQALAWLRAQQQPDGSFGGFGPGTTLDVALALAAAGERADLRHASGASVRDYLTAVGPDYAERSAAGAGKLAMGLVALGADPRALPRGPGTYDVVGRLRASSAAAVGDPSASVWDLAWAILGLRAAGEDPGAELVDALAAAASPAGGWAYAKAAGEPDADSTGLAMMALAAAGRTRAELAIQRAEAYLLRSQLAGGGWGFDGQVSADSTAMAVLGLRALGHAVEDAGWMRGPAGHWASFSPIDAILAQRQADGSFRGASPLLSTAAAALGLSGVSLPLPPAPRRAYLPMALQVR